VPVISLQNVSVSFGDVSALQDISFRVEKGDYIGLIGPNGAGKSTLLKVMLGIIPPTKGKVIIPETVTFGYVPQNYLPENFFSLSVQEILEMGLMRMSFFRKKSERKIFTEKLSVVGLDESFLKKSFHSLSGGQKQRVIIARSLLQDPNILLFDEPLSGVDYTTKLQIYELLSSINQKYAVTIIFVSHEIESIIQKCKRILCLNKKLHEGCHPIDFMQGKLESCPVLESINAIRPIHHHHQKP
jgi:zinc transport system ATP-binding protein